MTGTMRRIMQSRISITDTMRTLRRAAVRLLALWCSVALLALPAARAAEPDVPFDIQVKLLCAALTYEQTIQKDTKAPLTIGILYFPGVSHSQDQAEQISKAFSAFKGKTISGRSLNTMMIAFAGNDALTKKLSGHTIQVLYIADGTTEACRDITRLTQSLKVLSLTSDVALVTECQVALAVGLEDNKPRIYLNLPAAQAEGADFSSKLLRVVTIIGEVQR